MFSKPAVYLKDISRWRRVISKISKSFEQFELINLGFSIHRSRSRTDDWDCSGIMQSPNSFICSVWEQELLSSLTKYGIENKICNPKSQPSDSLFLTCTDSRRDLFLSIPRYTYRYIKNINGPVLYTFLYSWDDNW